MFATRLSKLSQALLMWTVMLTIALLLQPVTYAQKETSFSPEERRRESEMLRQEGRKFYSSWEMTRDSAYLHKAIESYRKAIQTDSTYYRPYESLSYPLNLIGDRKGAIAACEKSEELLGDNKSTVLAWLGALYYREGQREKALDAFKRQILLDPHSSIFYEDTKYYLRVDNQCEAVRSFMDLGG